MSTPAATFDQTLPTDLDWMRFILGDMNMDAPLRSDAQYQALLASSANRYLACAEMAESLASEYAQQPDSFTAVGDVSLSWRERVKTWEARALQMRQLGGSASAGSGAASLLTVREYEIDPEYTVDRW